MKKLFTLLLVLTAGWVLGKENIGKQSVPATKITAGCATSTGTFDLDIANVRARIHVGGDMWWDLIGSAKYEVPKGSGKHALFAGAFWFGCYDANGNLKVAAQTYRQNSNDYWAGPISTLSGTPDVSATTCSAYDRVWSILKTDVQNFITTGTTTVNDILTYPGNGDIANGELQFLAPFYDANGDGIYNSINGDYPDFNLSGQTGSGNCTDYVHGDQCLFWVFNDVGNTKTETNSAAIGLEVRAQAYAFDSVNFLENITFYQYQIINRSSVTLDSCYIGGWVDPDLGDSNDDYVGCDVLRGLGYCYNSTNNDAIYGLNPPAIGLDFLQGPVADAGDLIDNDLDGTVDEPGETISMSKFLYYDNINANPYGNPNATDDYYQYLSGSWLNGDRWTRDGLNGHDQAFPSCSYLYSDNTDPSFISFPSWTEATAGNVPSDRRFLSSVGEFTLQPGAIQNITTSVIWARDTVGGPLASVALMQLYDDSVQIAFDSCFSPRVLGTGVSSVEVKDNFLVSPNPFSQQTTFCFADAENNLTIFDTHGKVVYENKSIKQKSFVFKRNNLKAGVYYYQIITKSKHKSFGRLLIQ